MKSLKPRGWGSRETENETVSAHETQEIKNRPLKADQPRSFRRSLCHIHLQDLQRMRKGYALKQRLSL